MSIVLLHYKATACFYSYYSDKWAFLHHQKDTEKLLQLWKVLQHKCQPLAMNQNCYMEYKILDHS